MASKSREELMKEATALHDRAVTFRNRMTNPALHKSTQTVEFLRARTARDAVIERIVREHPGPWSEDEQQLMRPL